MKTFMMLEEWDNGRCYDDHMSLRSSTRKGEENKYSKGDVGLRGCVF